MFRIPLISRPSTGLIIFASAACAACAGAPSASEDTHGARTFYTVTGELALSRHEPRVAALQYSAAVQRSADLDMLRRAAEVTAQCLQPSLTIEVADRWVEVEPASLDAQRAAGKAALDLDFIAQSADHYHAVLAASTSGVDTEFAKLDAQLSEADNVYGARRLADRLVGYYPGSTAALRMQAYAAMRADDPAAAAHGFMAALATMDQPNPPSTSDETARREITQSLWRAQILSGDSEAPLAQARERLSHEASVANRLDYALLLLAAQQNPAARDQLVILTKDTKAAPAALRLLGLLDYQDGHLDDAGTRFAQLVITGKYLDDALYYLGLIAERHQDLERALRLYAQVQDGDYALQALLRAATSLRAHGAAPAAEEIFDRLVEEEPQRAPEILASRARIYEDAGDFTQAANVLDLGIQEYPDSVELKYSQASLQENRGNVSGALRVLKAVVKQRPGDPAAQNAYGYTLADHSKHLRLARRLIENAYASSPKSPAILDSFGWVLYRQGHDVDALPYLNAAYADDRSGDIAAHLGEVLWQLGRKADADRIWAEAGVLDPDSRLLKATRQRLNSAK